MKNICLLFILFLVSALISNSQEDEYWTLVPGSIGQYLVQTDSTTMVLITNEWSFVEEEGYYRNNSLNFHYFNMEGELINSMLLNFHEIDSLKTTEPLRAANRIAGRSAITKLANGKYLVGGHGNIDSTYMSYLRTSNNIKEPYLNNYTDSLFLHNFNHHSTLAAIEKEDSLNMTNPMIFTFNPALDSLLKVDTLEAVPYYGSVVLIREIAPDTLIIGYHKSNESRHEIMETDSLFNVRWKTEFGQIDAWVADIYDFEVTGDGDYLVSMYYYYQWSRKTYLRNRLFKFCKTTGELLWQKIIRNENNISFNFTLTSLEDDRFLLAYDDCCLGPSGTSLDEYVFHENTGLHLRVIDKDGNIIEQKSLVDFLSAHIYTHGSPGSINYENPDKAVPWYIPLKSIKNPDNTFLISGILRSTASTYYLRGFLLKLDENLEPLWVRVFEIDKKNYIYDCYNTLRLNNILNSGDNIFLGGTFESIGSNCPYYEPFYFDFYFWSGILVPLDEYGCYEPGCHLYDNIPEWEFDSFITFYPNPATTTLNVIIDRQAIEQKEKTLFISDLSGRGMLTKHFTGNELQVSINNFSPGIYLAYIFSEGHILKAEKIVVK